jgi:hypothetical protein
MRVIAMKVLLVDTEGSGSEEEEVVVPRKRARMAGAPSRVPVLVAESQTRARQ